MTFKHIALTFALCASACVSKGAPAAVPQDTLIKSEIARVFDDLVSATKTQDHAHYFSFFDTATFTALNADGSTLPSLEAFRALYEPQLSAVQGYNFLTFDPVHISVLDANTAILVNEYTAEIVLASGDVVSASGAGTQVWSKRAGKWKLVHISDAQKR